MNTIDFYWIIWYSIGVIGGLIIAYKADHHISVWDFIVCITLYGLGGPVAICLGSYHLYKLRKFYKKYNIKY